MGYPGSKAQAGVFQRIIGQIPATKLYVEAFFGSGQVFWRMRRAERSIVIDRLPGLIARAGAEAGVSAICGDAISVLPKLALPAEAVVYCDPPYLLSTRKGRIYYEHEMSERAHTSLLTLLKKMRSRVLLSGYPSELYSSQLQDWRCISYKTRTRGRTVTECLWCNFPEPAELHDWIYAGKNFRQRLSLKRLARRWLARLEGMPERKRGYVLHAVHQRWFERYLPASPRPSPELAFRSGTIDQNSAAAAGVTSAR